MEKLTTATHNTIKDGKNLIYHARGASIEGDPSNRLNGAVKRAIEATANFLENAKINRKQQTPETNRILSESSDEFVKCVALVVEASKVLPGSEEALKLFQETDELESLAEKELTEAASTIAEAAKTLLAAKQKQMDARKNKDFPLPEEEIAEAVLDAARSITNATATLVASASVAQAELVQQGKSNTNQENMYRRDPTWAKGLISAAQSVAYAVKELVRSSSQGSAEEELVATAKGVAAATARLVFASRTKADPFSHTQKKLSSAAKSVAEATQQLVSAAKLASQLQAEEDSKPNWEGEASEALKRKVEMDTQVNILKLQKELQKERERLADLRREEYRDANRRRSSTPSLMKMAPRPPSARLERPKLKEKIDLPRSRSNSTAGPELTRSRSNSRVQEFYTLEELTATTKPVGCDITRLEQYLTDEDFEKAFKMTKMAFYALPAFRQSSEKQKIGLFVA
eukprot:TRINITY_DN6528_c0_g2_i1.p1 TRINITY_DN6528_c0_g2~~TRINITY_DN6528_c0_g2_i1.p1  ORF type:complete len:505 (+),score=186.44 TRINITY_DN6528_c0_g2_i1:137-1516(+)